MNRERKRNNTLYLYTSEKCLCVWVKPSFPPLRSQQSRNLLLPGMLTFNILLFLFSLFIGMSFWTFLFLFFCVTKCLDTSFLSAGALSSASILDSNALDI